MLKKLSESADSRQPVFVVLGVKAEVIRGQDILPESLDI